MVWRLNRSFVVNISEFIARSKIDFFWINKAKDMHEFERIGASTWHLYHVELIAAFLASVVCALVIAIICINKFDGGFRFSRHTTLETAVPPILSAALMVSLMFVELFWIFAHIGGGGKYRWVFMPLRARAFFFIIPDILLVSFFGYFLTFFILALRGFIRFLTPLRF